MDAHGILHYPLKTVPAASGMPGVSWVGADCNALGVLQDDFAPLLIGEDALDHERLWRKLYKRLQSVGRLGLVIQAQARWISPGRLKVKMANCRFTSFWRCCRESAPVYGSDGGWLYMSVPEMVAAFEGYLEQGMMGVKMKIGP